MADGPATPVRGFPLTAEVLRSYGKLLLVAADRMNKGELTVGEASSIIESMAPCGALTIEMSLILHEPRTLN